MQITSVGSEPNDTVIVFGSFICGNSTLHTVIALSTVPSDIWLIKIEFSKFCTKELILVLVKRLYSGDSSFGVTLESSRFGNGLFCEDVSPYLFWNQRIAIKR